MVVFVRRSNEPEEHSHFMSPRSLLRSEEPVHCASFDYKIDDLFSLPFGPSLCQGNNILSKSLIPILIAFKTPTLTQRPL